MNKSEVKSKKTFSIFTNITTKTCKFCAKTFKTGSSIRRHIRAKHLNEGNIHQCEICYRNFPVRFDLKKHIEKNHENNKAKCKCNLCEKAFSAKNYLDNHTHT